MNTKPYYTIVLLCISLIYSGCSEDFLDAKPSSSIVNPVLLSDYQNLLDNSDILNITAALPQASSDEYYVVDQSDFDAIPTVTQKNLYLWQKDIYGGESNILDWNQPYKAVFYANSVLDGINKIEVTPSNEIEWNNIKGAALFFRSFAFYDLARNFCPVYNETTALNDLGIPLRTSSGIDVTMQRSNLKETYDRIISDLNQAKSLLRDDFSTINRNRPSKAAVDALLARIYLSMGNYKEAAGAANACLLLYDKIIDYNSVDKASATPFTYSSDETIFYANQIIAYSSTTGYNSRPAIAIDSNLIKTYDKNDLRLSIFFAKNTIGNYNIKRGYVGGGLYAFTGLATDEIMLIKAECAARSDDPQTAIATLNELLEKRYTTGTFIPLTYSSTSDALSKVLIERRKELVWRALRWSDLKRLNKEGANITLKRTLNGTDYLLAPNSPLYVFPIPEDEISLSGIQQNNR